jgi:glucose-1-phosphate thymidylyltransferase
MKFDNEGQILVNSVKNPENYGVLVCDKKGLPKKIIEKPKKFIGSDAVVGLYFYKNSALKYLNSIKPSKRKELEITDFNNILLQKKLASYERLGRGFAWLDTGSPTRLLEASNFVEILEKRQGFKVACLEEIALKQKFISRKKFLNIISTMANSEYKEHLKKL